MSTPRQPEQPSYPNQPLQPTGGPWMTITEAAAYASISPDTIRRAIKLKRLRASRPARLWRVLRADLDAFMDGGAS